MGLSPVWRAVAALYVLVNLGGVVWAANRGETMHTELHVVLLLAGVALAMWWRGRQRGGPSDIALAPEAQRLDHLQQSVDAIALEVERIGEAQRFTAKLQAERTRTPS